MTIPLEYFLAVGAALFVTGSVGFLLRRNLLVLLMSIELMLNAVNLTLVAYNRHHAQNHGGQIFTFFVIAVAAAEAAWGSRSFSRSTACERRSGPTRPTS